MNRFKFTFEVFGVKINVLFKIAHLRSMNRLKFASEASDV